MGGRRLTSAFYNMEKKRCLLSSRDVEIPELPSAAELSGDEIVSLIIKHGRASIAELPDGTLEIDFQTGYD